MATCTVVREAYPDHTALDKTSPYFDPKSSSDNPRWFMVDVKLKKQLKLRSPLLRCDKNQLLWILRCYAKAID